MTAHASNKEVASISVALAIELDVLKAALLSARTPCSTNKKPRYIARTRVGRPKRSARRRQNSTCPSGVKNFGAQKCPARWGIEADKAAQANLIKRREETAAARSQANTAKLLAENPVLARMKELEVLKEVLEGAKLTFVVGERDLIGQIRRLTAEGDGQ